MAQPEFTMPDFLEDNSAEEIHERMMNNLPDDIDDMPGGFPYDLTMPAALEKDELINFHLVRSLMIAYPQYAWGEWLDLHGQQVHLKRHQPVAATGQILVTGTPETEIEAGTVFCTPSVDDEPTLDFESTEDAVIGEDGTVLINIVAVEAGKDSNVAANTITLMESPLEDVTEVINPEALSGGTDEESDDDYYDRIAAEYDSSLTYLGNDTDYIRWAKEAGAGDCIVVDAYDGPGTVKLVLVDQNGRPANEALIETVYNYIVSPDDRSARLLPTACAKLTCEAASTKLIDYVITGLLFNSTTSIEQIKIDFAELVKTVYGEAKDENLLRYNDVRPLIKDIPGVEDFEEFLMNGGTVNITLNKGEYPETGVLDFTGGYADG